MTQEDFDRATLAEQILYNCTGMLAKNHPTIIEVMDKYHQAKLKLLGLHNVIVTSVCGNCGSDEIDKAENYCNGCDNYKDDK